MMATGNDENNNGDGMIGDGAKGNDNDDDGNEGRRRR